MTKELIIKLICYDVILACGVNKRRTEKNFTADVTGDFDKLINFMLVNKMFRCMSVSSLFFFLDIITETPATWRYIAGDDLNCLEVIIIVFLERYKLNVYLRWYKRYLYASHIFVTFSSTHPPYLSLCTYHENILICESRWVYK